MAYYTPMHNIVIDQEKCGNAYPCLACVHACIDHGQNCLMFINKETPQLGDNTPKSLADIPHIVKTYKMQECDGCQECIKACPKGALTFVPAKRHLPRAKIERPGVILNCPILKDGTNAIDPTWEEEIIYIGD